MNGISGSPTLSAAQLSNERLIKTTGLVKDAIDQQGQNAIKLIESAVVEGVGQNLNIQV